MSLSLNCLVLGDDLDRIFDVEIPKTANVMILKKLIKEEKAPHFNHVAASDLDLWKVSFPLDDHLEKKLEDIKLAEYPKLSPPFKPLTTFFTDFAANCMHIIVKPPVIAHDSSQLLSLNCFVYNDDPDQTFTVKIPETENVSILKDLIKEKKAKHFKDFDASELQMWKVSFPIDDLPSSSSKPPTLGPKLRSEKRLSEVFSSGLDNNHVHIVVRLQDQGSRPPPSAFRFPIPPTDEVGNQRQKFCNTRKSEAPSNGGNPQTFLMRQNIADECIPCNRPYGCPTALPLSLLHPVFGEFVDNADTREPTSDDAAFTLAFVEAMANIYRSENDRRDACLKVFNAHNISIYVSAIGKYQTDGDMSVGEHKFLIAEFKNEVGSAGAEPFFQLALYFLEATRNMAHRRPNSVLPCMLVIIFGPYIAFAGAAWTNRPTVQMLSVAIPCNYQDTDIMIERMIAQHLGALRKAIQSLEKYYEEYKSDSQRNPNHPYPTSFMSQNGSKTLFTYRDHAKARLNLFFGNLQDDNTAICIKFVPRYCEEGHKFFAAKGLAPALHAVERLPGGMYMVIMDDVSEEYVSLFELVKVEPNSPWLLEKHRDSRNLFLEQVKQHLLEFHKAGFVHGDFRDTNIMVKKAGFSDGSFKVVDFDSCGQKGQVQYPLTLNTTTVKRPQGATGGASIKAEHDLIMLDGIWDRDP